MVREDGQETVLRSKEREKKWKKKSQSVCRIGSGSASEKRSTREQGHLNWPLSPVVLPFFLSL